MSMLVCLNKLREDVKGKVNFLKKVKDQIWFFLLTALFTFSQPFITNSWGWSGSGETSGQTIENQLTAVGRGVANFSKFIGGGLLIGLYLIFVVAGFGFICWLAYKNYKQAQKEHENAALSALITFLLGFVVYIILVSGLFYAFDKAVGDQLQVWLKSIFSTSNSNKSS